MRPDQAYDSAAAHPAPGIPALARGCLHEVHAGIADWAAALAFVLAGTGASADGPVLMALGPRRGAPPMRLCGAGLGALGIDPARLLLVEARDERALLRAGLDAARCPRLAAVVLAAWGRFALYDLTASRRLVLAAESSGLPVIVLRGDAEPRSSAAHTRWAIRPAPSVALPADAPGLPAIEAELLRQRGGAAGRRWRLEWDFDKGDFRECPEPRSAAGDGGGADAPSLSGAVVPLFRLREGEERSRVA